MCPFQLRDHRVPDFGKAYEEPKPTRRGPLNNFNLIAIIIYIGADELINIIYVTLHVTLK